MANTFYKETDGDAVDFELSYSISGQKPILINDIPGFPYESGNSGDLRALSADGAVYRVQFPAGLSVSIGDTVHVDTTAVTEHEIPDAAYTTTSSGDTVPFVKVISEKDANNWADVKLINFSA